MTTTNQEGTHMHVKHTFEMDWSILACINVVQDNNVIEHVIVTRGTRFDVYTEAPDGQGTRHRGSHDDASNAMSQALELCGFGQLAQTVEENDGEPKRFRSLDRTNTEENA